ncbi:hypothetical protein FRC09_014710 [Ceratobasidium sp. 395]|nr:hypothetical protein FRC09_014710 [Ceratobasidium sp. 395]
MSTNKLSAIPLPGPSPQRFVLSTSDILEGGQKVYIRNEKTGEIKWCKTRILAHKEIIDEIRTPEPSNTLKYTIHRPTRGWYIHIRSTAGTMPVPLALTPNPLVHPDRTDADSELLVQLPIRSPRKGKERERVPGLRDQDEWSFPPTPPIRSPPRRAPPKETESASTTQPSSPTTSKHTDPLRSPSPPQSSNSIISKLAPHVPPPPTPTISLVFAPLPPPVLPQKQPVLSRAYASGVLRVIANTLFSPPRRSFVLSARLPATPDQPDREPVTTPAIEAGPAGLMGGRVVPVLTYTDTTPVLAVSKMTGVLAIDMNLFETMLTGRLDEASEDEDGKGREEDIGLVSGNEAFE